MESVDPDYVLAMLLQAKYNKETKNQTDKIKKKSVVPATTSSISEPVTTSLVDPIWETVDPTPNIHALFLSFNKQFFWGRLESVEVCWSQRMTSCAGVCSYQNRSGFCSVRLSAPLLKLRPRSDLVETLLHEMIHAYLFVTNNDRDRDGHGPTFQSHMYRINKKAGTNITIYHSFHDEVNSYQQHWWRCNGPCKDRRPYFGFVKRSMNRAPGPNDIWWTEHQAMCGGSFTKIKEPEGFGKKKKSGNIQNKKNLPKITGFFKSKDTPSTNNRTEVSTNILSNSNTIKSNIVDLANLQVPTEPTKSSKTDKNVYGFQDYENKPNVISTGAVRKTGFQKSETQTSNKNKSNPGVSSKSNITGFGNYGMLNNKGSGTLVVTSKSWKNEKEDNKEHKPNILPFSGTGYVLGGKPSMKNSRVFNSKLFSSRNKFFSSEPESCETSQNKIKKPKLDNVSEVEDIVEVELPLEEYCPICNINVSKINIKNHLDICTGLADDNTVPNDDICECPVCNTSISRSIMNSHFEDCMGLSNVFNGSSALEDFNEENTKNTVLCPCCDNQFTEFEINNHLDECLNMSLHNELDDLKN